VKNMRKLRAANQGEANLFGALGSQLNESSLYVTPSRYMRRPAKHLRNAIELAATVALAAVAGLAQSLPGSVTARGIEWPAPDGTIILPSSSIVRPDDAVTGRVHTNIILYIHPDNSQPGPTWETPASIACVYQLVPQVSGCPINGTTISPTGGSGAIAIVDAYHYPTAGNDLAVFSSKFGLPPANLTVVYANGVEPPQDPTGEWQLEEAMDIEWAHAMAPQAKLFLVEAASASPSDMYYAEQVASNLVTTQGGGEVSNSWGLTEFSGEQAFDSYFNAPRVAYFASTGDYAFYISYPAVSPNVIAAGGTSLQRDTSGNFIGEVYWDNIYGGGGAGISSYESIPLYQTAIASIVGTHRGVPDISADADPLTGVAVYDSTPFYGQTPSWIQVGGTSLSSPMLAGIANAASAGADTASQLTEVYTDYGSPAEYAAEFRDITKGNSKCGVGWDICTGVGSPLTYGSMAVPDFLLTVTPIEANKITVQGFRVTVTAVGGFSGTVALSCTVTAGACSLNPTTIVGSGTSIMTGSNALLDWDMATVTGTSGSLKHQVDLSYSIPPPCKPGVCQ
jgi:subtilase family serine protease